MGDFETSTKEALKEEAPQLRFKVGESEAEAEVAPVAPVVEPPLVETSGKSPEESEGAKPTNDAVKSDVTAVIVAMPFLLFYLLRGFRFFLSMAAIAGSVILIAGLLALAKFSWGDTLIHSGIWPMLIAGLIAPFASSFNIGKGTPLGVLNVVDKNGQALTPYKALMRAVVFMFTWFIFPLHLIFIAAGSRRLLHDIVSGAYVITPGEDLKTTFYPSAPRWMAPLLVVAVVAMLCMQSNFTSYVQRLESLIVPIVLGLDSKLYLDYLKTKFDPAASSLGYSYLYDGKAAGDDLSKIEVMTNLQIKYNGRHNFDTARYLIYTAQVAAKSGDNQTAEQYLDTFVSLPYSFQSKALEPFVADAFAIESNSPRLYCARLYSEIGALKKAINIAESEKAKARSLENYEVFERCCAYLHKFYQRTGRLELAQQEREDLVKSLKYHALYLQQNSHSDWKQEMEPELRLLEDIDWEGKR